MLHRVIFFFFFHPLAYRRRNPDSIPVQVLFHLNFFFFYEEKVGDSLVNITSVSNNGLLCLDYNH